MRGAYLVCPDSRTPAHDGVCGAERSEGSIVGAEAGDACAICAVLATRLRVSTRGSDRHLPRLRSGVYNGSKHCTNRRCERFGKIWAGDQRTKIFRNLEACKAQRVRMGSLTAPGKASLPFDPRQCTHESSDRCSGERGCRVDKVAADCWNDSMPKLWRELHRRAYTKTIRKHGAKNLRMALRVFELQKRGVLHMHPVFEYGTPSQRAAVDFYFETLVPLAQAYGFGTQHEAVTMPRMEVAAYLSSYFASGTKAKITLTEAVQSNAMPRSIIHVSTRLTCETGITMRALRARRFHWVLDQLDDLEFASRYSAEALRPATLRCLLQSPA